jgi:hypothetical protein
MNITTAIQPQQAPSDPALLLEHRDPVPVENGGATTAAVIPLRVIQEINETHQLVRSSAENVVKYAIKCGELLLEQKKCLQHGEFGKWIATNCVFSQATANIYMKAAGNPNALGNSLRHLFPSGRPGATRQATPNAAASADDPVKVVATPKTALDSINLSAHTKKKAILAHDGKPALAETINMISTALSVFFTAKKDFNLDFKSISATEAADFDRELEIAVKSIERLRKGLARRSGGAA